MTVQPLYGQVRDYAWGSRTAIARIQGRPVPSAVPEAELWLGAHPAAPSSLATGPLPEALAADPAGLLGAPVIAEYGARLPYLLKVLAADAPLSIQAHPDPVRARDRYAAGHPAYADPYHKPELLVAVEDFDALCGFRAPAESADLLESLGIDALKPVVSALSTGPDDAARLRNAVELLMSWPVEERTELVGAVAAADGSAAELAAHYPGDVGVVVALLLNRVRLAPDEAVWMPAGNLHAYLRGTGVEIMAASDNVLRGGLTPKPVHVPELLRVLRFEVLAEPVRRPVPVGPGLLTWPTPVREFALHKATVAGTPVTLPGGGPRILFCLRGTVEVAGLPLAAGTAAFADAGEPPVECVGDGVVFQAGTPAI
ncbi:MAG: mannose-6-phosphate isomerase, class I [Actinobacteria bacterium]|nr:MAG: mannose-6-phosphate isomerase, class I [Actinomycetota bacterium]